MMLGEQLGEIRLWPLDNVAALRQHVARLFPDQAENRMGLRFRVKILGFRVWGCSFKQG